jgi:hypothetical protein
MIKWDNAQTFKVTAEWVKIIRNSEKIQNFLANEEIRWQFNLAKSPWWGGFYERLIMEVKKTLYKSLGKSHLSFEGMEQVVMDIDYVGRKCISTRRTGKRHGRVDTDEQAAD